MYVYLLVHFCKIYLYIYVKIIVKVIVKIYLYPLQTPPKTTIKFLCIVAECADVGGGVSNVFIAVHLFDFIEYTCNSLNNFHC